MERGESTVGGLAMACRGRRRATEASATPCSPVGLSINGDREREQKYRMARKVFEIVAGEFSRLAMAAGQRNGLPRGCSNRTGTRSPCSSRFFYKKDEQ